MSLTPTAVEVTGACWYLGPMQREGLAGKPAGAAAPGAGRQVPGGELGRDEDRALIEAVTRGERRALAALYDRNAPVLLALGTRILGDRALAEDVLHDVFLEAWHHAREFDAGRGSVRAWLVTRMRSRALDRRAKVLRIARLARDAGQDAVAGTRAAAAIPGAVPAEVHDGIAGPDRERIRRGIAGLPPELVAVIELAYFEGRSATEIGAHLGVPAGTVKSRLARAIVNLRAQIWPEGGEVA